MIKRFEQFVSGITVCYKYIQRIKALEMPELEPGMKGSHVMCIFYLEQNPDGLTAAQLSNLCQEDKAAISRTLSELVERGFVAGGEKDGKRYRALLVLTEKGQALAEKVDKVISRWVEAGGDGLSEEERAAFYHGLELISGNLKDKYGEKTL